MFLKKATKIDEIFTVDLTLTTQIDGVKILSNFVAFLENINFKAQVLNFTIEDFVKFLQPS